jgi:hypothetical protein
MKRIAAVLIAVLACATFGAAETVQEPLTARDRENFRNMFRSGGVGLVRATVAPATCATATKGLQYFDTSDNTVKTCDGTAYREAALIGSTGTAETITTGDVLNGTLLNADINASAAIARSKLAEDALQAHPATLLSNTGQALTAAETAGTFDITIGTNTIAINGEVTDNETETSVGYFPFVLPPNYVAAGDASVVFNSALIKTGSPTNNASTLDLSCYEQASVAVGDDLVATAAATYAALDTYYAKTFVLTATDLVAGDILLCKVTTAIVDSEAGAGTIIWTSDPIKVLLDVKG